MVLEAAANSPSWKRTPGTSWKNEGLGHPLCFEYVGVSMAMGNPHSWMVDFMENRIKADDFGVPLSQETPILSFVDPCVFSPSKVVPG